VRELVNDELDHLVGGSEQLVGHSEAEYPGGLGVDDPLELGRLHDRQLLRLRSLEDAARYGEYGPYEQVWTPCWNQYRAIFMRNAEGHWVIAALFALVPLPIAWLIAYALVYLVRWIRAVEVFLLRRVRTRLALGCRAGMSAFTGSLGG